MADTGPWIVGASTAAVAVACALLVWSAADIGSKALARYRQAFTEQTHSSLRELFLFIEPRQLFALNLALIVLTVVAAGLLSGSVGLAMCAGAAASLLPRAVLRTLRQRRMFRLEQQLPDALMMVAGGLRAGSSLTGAIQQLVLEAQAPVSQEFDLLLREQRLGVTLDQALENLLARVPLASVTLTVSAMRIAQETGGQLAETLERTSHTLRAKLAMEGKIRALTAQGKLQAWVVGLLPVAMLLVLREMEPAAMGLLFTTPMGWATLMTVAVLEVFGVLLIRRIVAIDV